MNDYMMRSGGLQFHGDSSVAPPYRFRRVEMKTIFSQFRVDLSNLLSELSTLVLDRMTSE